MDIQFVNPNILISRQTPNEISNSKVKRLRKKIREQGFDESKPIEVANIDGRLIILDGHHRVIAARQQRLLSIPIKVNQVSAEEELQLLLEASSAALYNQY